MTTFTFEIDQNSLRRLEEKITGSGARELIGKGLEAGAKHIAMIAKGNINSPKSGRSYRLPGGGSYIASAPGEAPANVTGDLIAGIVVEGSGLEWLVKSTSDHAWLEYGGRRIAPRPYLYPAAVEGKDTVTRFVAEVFK